MSIVSLLIGQCGNQVGLEFFKTIYNDNYDGCNGQAIRWNDEFANESMETFFNVKGEGVKPEARCVQVDMEEKVIRQINAETSGLSAWRYPQNSFFAQRGSGNNWALGYLLNGPSCVEVVDDILAAELEKCDSVDGLITTMSLAGGTGSGVGTYLLRHIGDMCPKVPVLAQLVLPYRRGEVATQAYNAVLSLGHLLCASPGEAPCGLLLHENDLLHRACANRLIHHYRHQTHRFVGPLDQVPLVELNRLMAHLLGGVLQPYIGPSRGYTLCRRRLSHLLFDLAGPADYRLYRLHCLPYHPSSEARHFATETWPQLLRHTRQLLLTGACLEDKMNWCVSLDNLRGHRRQPLLACTGVARGTGAGEVLWSELTAGLDVEGVMRPWRVNASLPMGVCTRAFNGHLRGVFLATNGGGLVAKDDRTDGGASTDVCAPLRLLRSRAWRLFTSSAYLHQYSQFGMEDPRASLLDAFAVVEQTIYLYSQLTTS
ncbi:Tubulin delta chain [Echinococcus granulosus]|uniref:Tubulin delta chain n=1 Tax=Echinococcus granulosus TaxID=6210 RepID=W6UXZ5_ECHGR|nr:Tubulin delta chain [Echinococcus granulosus]EUB58434.1 Tubulin delta chain [Echinococcus granulosus]KAH9286829.1 Tubulin delta chain [Echinococcus granulosus]